MMRILIIGQAAFGAKVLEALAEKGENIVAVYTPAEKPGGRPDPLKDAALARGIKVLQPSTFKDEHVLAEYKENKPDLTVLAFVTDIIPVGYFEVPSQGAVCYHPSLLPRHRGASAINWAVIMGDTRTGLTIFWPDGGIDTGPILLQKEIAIGPDDTTGSLYFNHLFPMGVEAILESVALIKAGQAPRIPQDDAQATYEPPCDDRVAGIDWNKSAAELYNLVRGCDPQPGALASFQGTPARFYGAQLDPEPAAQAPGTILQIDDQGLQVAVAGGRLNIAKIKPEAGKKASAAEWAAGLKIKAGDRFDT
ncbi:MAG: methionyl-tRNA formyltransferase [Desulfobacterales bacterium]|nr:MAG: methionyl-tRNA formyltransferase [Desulfobacterales bacterium]